MAENKNKVEIKPQKQNYRVLIYKETCVKVFEGWVGAYDLFTHK